MKLLMIGYCFKDVLWWVVPPKACSVMLRHRDSRVGLISRSVPGTWHSGNKYKCREIRNADCDSFHTLYKAKISFYKKCPVWVKQVFKFGECSLEPEVYFSLHISVYCTVCSRFHRPNGLDLNIRLALTLSNLIFEHCKTSSEHECWVVFDIILMLKNTRPASPSMGPVHVKGSGA